MRIMNDVVKIILAKNSFDTLKFLGLVVFKEGAREDGWGVGVDGTFAKYIKTNIIKKWRNMGDKME
jgi:hypothetical protein